MHGHDPGAVGEHHVHVVLDDHRGDAARAHHLGDDVHDRRLLARAHPAGGLVEEEQLGAQRVGHRHVQELALALGQPARRLAGAGVQPELLQHHRPLVAHRGVGVGEREQAPGAPLAGEDREGHVVLDRELVEEVHELEAARDAEPDLVMDRGPRDVGPLEVDPARVGRDQPADQVDERGLPRAVGADEGEHLARRHREVHVVHRAGGPEGLGELGGLEEIHDQTARTGRGRRRRTVPTMPAGRASTSTTSTMPRTICQYTVWPTA